jgi:hypothetical protein
VDIPEKFAEDASLSGLRCALESALAQHRILIQSAVVRCMAKAGFYLSVPSALRRS